MRPEDAPDPSRIEQPLLRHMRAVLSMPELDYQERPARIAVGAESAIYGFELRGAAGTHAGELVCRLLPPGGEFGQIQKEAAAQRALKVLGIPVPAVVCLGDVEAGLGGPFLVMQRVRGCGGLSIVLGLALLLGAAVVLGLGWIGALGFLGFQVANVLTQRRIHRLSAERYCELLEKEEVAADSQRLAAWMEWLEVRIDTVGAEGLRPGLAWLREGLRLRNGPEVVCHGDFWPGNLIFGWTGLRAIIDWPTASVAEREFDLGWSLVQDASDLPFVTALPESLTNVVGVACWPFEWFFVGSHRWVYRVLFATDRDALRYYAAFHTLRMLVSISLADAGATPMPSWSTQRARRTLLRRFRRFTGLDLSL